MDAIQPIVLVGGRSSRFGRDKLREPIRASDGSTTWLIDASISALRAVFGPRVAAVGECDPVIAARADLVIPDKYPNRGPLGGIVAALEHAQSDIFVLAGDLPHIHPDDIRAIRATAAQNPNALAAWATTDRPQPCIALYRNAALPLLRAALELQSAPPLHTLFPATTVIAVPIPHDHAANINRPSDLP